MSFASREEFLRELGRALPGGGGLGRDQFLAAMGRFWDRAAGRYTPQLVQIANRAEAAQPQLSSGGSTQISYRKPFRCLASCSAVRLLYTNRQMVLTNGEVTPAHGYTLKATFETPEGDLLPVTFNGNGTREPAVAAGAEILSDPIPVRLLAGQTFFIRSRPLSAVLGDFWPIGGPALLGTLVGGGHQAGDTVDSPSSGFTLASVPFGPAAVLGLVSGLPQSRAMIWGDSIAYGSGDVQSAEGDSGFLARAMTQIGVPHIKFASPGLAFQDWIGTVTTERTTKTSYARSLIERVRPTHAVMSMGNNDIHNAGTPLADCQSRFLRWCSWMEAMGMWVIATTITPRTTGSWNTLAGQTKSTVAVNDKRRAFNAWILGRPHPAIVDVYDIASVVQEPSDPDLWRVNGGAWTNDGTHPSPLGHTAIRDMIVARGSALPIGA